MQNCTRGCILILCMCILYIATKAVKFTPTPQVPALQYIGNVEVGGSADLAGLKTGDFLLEVSHYTCTCIYSSLYIHVYMYCTCTCMTCLCDSICLMDIETCMYSTSQKKLKYCTVLNSTVPQEYHERPDSEPKANHDRTTSEPVVRYCKCGLVRFGLGALI